MKNYLSTFILSFALLFALSACSDDSGNNSDDAMNIAEVASENENLSTLVAALNKTGLTETVANTEDITVFAPTNDAFVDLLDGMQGYSSLDDFTTDEELNLLRNILLNHVLSGTLASTDLSTGYTNTLATGPGGANLSLFVNTANGVRLNGVSSVTTPDVEASNGIVHVVDGVINIPTVVTLVTANAERFSSLLAALTRDDQPDFASTLYGNDGAPFTVFAPTNASFTALINSNDSWNSLADIPTDLLTAVISHHVVPNTNIRSSDLGDFTQTPATLEGDPLTLTTPGASDAVADITDGSGNSGPVEQVDIQAGNGVIHVIGTVLIPDTQN